ncbi:hypothetical protein ACFL04_01615 [Patescibacteria group bacterium]
MNKSKIIHLSIDCFFASVEQAEHQDLTDRPVAVIDVNNRFIVSLSPQARTLGLRKNMLLSAAIKKSPTTRYLRGDIALYQKYSEIFYKILYSYTDNIEPLTLDQAYIDMGDVTIKQCQQMVNSIRQKFQTQLNLTARFGIAQNKITAYIACHSQKPNGNTYVNFGQEKKFLNSLDISNLPGIGIRTRRALQGYGIKTLRQLALAPDNFLKDEFGSPGLRLKNLAGGNDNRPIQKINRTKTISRLQTIKPTRNIWQIYSVINDLCLQLSHQLNNQSRQTTKISLVLYFNDKAKRQSIKIPFPIHNKQDIEKYALKILTQQLINGNNITKVEIKLLELTANIKENYFFNNTLSSIQNIQHSMSLLYHRFGWRSPVI